MFKKRVHKWGIDKKNKESEMRAVVRKDQQRRLIGKSSIFKTRGKRTEYKDAVRYWERKKLSVEDVLASCEARDITPEALECLTPVPSPPVTPAAFAVPEHILRVISDYCLGSFESGTWFSADPAWPCTSTKDTRSSIHDLDRFRNQTWNAASLFNQGEFWEAGQTLISSTSVIRETLLAENPLVLPTFFQLFIDLHWWRRPEIGIALMQQIITLGRIVLCEQHPIPKVTALLRKLNYDEQEDITEKTYSLFASHFESQLGFAHFSTMIFRHSHYQSDLRNNAQNGELKIRTLRGDIVKCEAFLGMQDLRCINLHIMLAESYRTIGQYDRAEREAVYILQVSQEVNTSRDQPELFAIGLRFLAINNLQQGNIIAGEAYAREYIASMMSTRGEYEPLARAMMLTLEEYLVRAGRLESARQLEQWRRTILAVELAQDPTIE